MSNKFVSTSFQKGLRVSSIETVNCTSILNSEGSVFLNFEIISANFDMDVSR